MWDKLKKQEQRCAEYCAALEGLRPELGEAEGRAELNGILPAELLTHAEECEACETAREEFWTSRRLLAGAFLGEAASEDVQALRGEDSPWLVTRVMATIAEREVEERRAKLEWSGAVSRLASRVALAAAAMLLVTSTWLYQPPEKGRVDSPARQSAMDSTSPYLFDSGAGTANVDDALAGGGERQQ